METTLYVSAPCGLLHGRTGEGGSLFHTDVRSILILVLWRVSKVRTIVRGNLMTEIGVFTKQVAGYSQALAVNSSITGNIILNGPRSGVNFNDGAFGGNIIQNNLMANLVRETARKHCFNGPS